MKNHPQKRALQVGEILSLAAFIEYVFEEKPHCIGFQTTTGYLLDWTSRYFWEPMSSDNWLELFHHNRSIHVESCGDSLLEEVQRSLAYLIEPGKEPDEIFGTVVERS